MTVPGSYVDYWRLYQEAALLPRNFVQKGFGPEGSGNPIDEVGAANVANGATEQALIDAVERARQAGSSWAAIGRAMGMTKHGAQQRFTGAADGGAAALLRAVLETCTRGRLVAIPKAMALLFPPLDWVRQGLAEGRYKAASAHLHGSDPYVGVSRDDFSRHHPDLF
ncbi:MAG: hypothetical protein ACP5VR_04390 [Acidimicrobiales bacterium]